MIRDDDNNDEGYRVFNAEEDPVTCGGQCARDKTSLVVKIWNSNGRLPHNFISSIPTPENAGNKISEVFQKIYN